MTTLAELKTERAELIEIGANIGMLGVQHQRLNTQIQKLFNGTAPEVGELTDATAIMAGEPLGGASRNELGVERADVAARIATMERLRAAKRTHVGKLEDRASTEEAKSISAKYFALVAKGVERVLEGSELLAEAQAMRSELASKCGSEVGLLQLGAAPSVVIGGIERALDRLYSAQRSPSGQIVEHGAAPAGLEDPR